ncbi:hypothetical protein NFX39_05010 [Fructobacillus sp. W13]|uniref:Uncharacterized protein n=1 Tax=Fructobacillus apis TaxID=2935017 RepID=A0ABT0ZR21_9LACO|nr:hypothetical protein [Fructobacillus apis]MCO0832438.1 hypothetical protein [Fructobacillus apis]
MINEKRYQNMSANEQILFEVVKELSLQMGEDTPEKPLSLSLYLFQAGSDDPDLKDKIVKATSKLLIQTDDLSKLTTADFYKVYQPLSNIFDDEADSANTIVYIVTWLGLNLMPILYPVAKELM